MTRCWRIGDERWRVQGKIKSRYHWQNYQLNSAFPVRLAQRCLQPPQQMLQVMPLVEDWWCNDLRTNAMFREHYYNKVDFCHPLNYYHAQLKQITVNTLSTLGNHISCSWNYNFPHVLATLIVEYLVQRGCCWAASDGRLYCSHCQARGSLQRAYAEKRGKELMKRDHLLAAQCVRFSDLIGNIEGALSAK
jgi:hypothetical protein